MKGALISLVVGISLSVAGVAQAGTDYKLKADGSTTQTSGKSSGQSVSSATATPGGDYQGLYEIRMWEDGDVPCKLTAKSRHVNTYSGKNATTNKCNGSAKSEKNVAFTNSDTYINGVQVCLNSKGDRIKGVKVFGKKLNRSNGSLSDAGSKKFERTNCKTWKTIRYCPAGKIAVGVKVSYTRQSLISDEFGGLALVCRTVIKK